jgi:hypothetical protein
VHAHQLVCSGTVEEGIDALIRAKRDLAQRVVASGEQALSQLSTEELRQLIRPQPEGEGGPHRWPASGGRSGSRRSWRVTVWGRAWSGAGAMPAAGEFRI